MVLLRRFELLLLAELGFEPSVSAISPQELGWLTRIELAYSPSQGVALPLSYSQHGTPRWIRTSTGRGLSSLPLPIGLESVVRVGRIELPLPPWQGGIVPVNQTHLVSLLGFAPRTFSLRGSCSAIKLETHGTFQESRTPMPCGTGF